MEQSNRHFSPPPRSLSEDDFVERFGTVYEHSPWIARATWRRGLGPAQDSVEGLAAALAATVEAASETSKLALIRAHPELGVRAARDGALTPESAREQAGAGLGRWPAPEVNRLQELNVAYRERFGFPFVMAIAGRSREEIMSTFQQRLNNEPHAERARALQEIHKIARLRLDQIAGYC